MNETGNIAIGELMEPDPILFTFGAPGWKILLAVFMFTLFLYLLFRWYKYRKNKYRRTALDFLASMDLNQVPAHHALFLIIKSLKQVAMSSYGREHLATINGVAFMEFLNEKTKEPLFSDLWEDTFELGLYKGKKAELKADELNNFYNNSINWIKNHRV